MNKMDDKYRYQPYHRNKNYEDGLEPQYQRYNQYSSSRHYDRLSNQNQMDFSSQQSQSMTYSYFPAQPPVPLMSNKITPPTTLSTTIPQERESWIRSVKKTKTTESTEQKTQYLETMLRMPQSQQQQKSSIDASTFDRIRFTNYQFPITMNTMENNNTNNLDENSFHLIGDINNHDEISTIEKILFNNELQSTTGKSSNQIVNCGTNLESSPWSGFLIDNCDEAEPSPLSPPSHSNPPLSSTSEELIQQNQENFGRNHGMLVNELDAADTERRQELKRQKRWQKKLQKKKKLSKTKAVQQQQITKPNSMSNVNNKVHEESSSDWIIEYDTTETDQISQMTEMVKKTSTTMTDEDKIDKINIILKKIKNQQMELRKLRQHVMSMLDEQPKSNSTNTTRQNSHTNQDLLMKFLDQPLTSGCWLCSGKTYTEVATQCNNIDEQ